MGVFRAHIDSCHVGGELKPGTDRISVARRYTKKSCFGISSKIMHHMNARMCVTGVWLSVVDHHNGAFFPSLSEVCVGASGSHQIYHECAFQKVRQSACQV